MSEFGTNNKDTETLKSCLQESRTPIFAVVLTLSHRKRFRAGKAVFAEVWTTKLFPDVQGYQVCFLKRFPSLKANNKKLGCAMEALSQSFALPRI